MDNSLKYSVQELDPEHKKGDLGNEGPLHGNYSTKLEPAHYNETVSASSSTAFAGTNKLRRPLPPTQYTSLASTSAANNTISDSSSSDDLSWNSRAIIVLFVLFPVLLLAMVVACVAFAVEIQQLNSSINRQAVEFHSALENTTQQLSSSINMFRQNSGQNFTTWNTGLQQLIAELTGQCAAFPLLSCAALPPSSPPGHYWVRTSTGSAVLVYCDPTRLCGGVTGGWRRVGELDMTSSSQQCPNALRQCNNGNISTCSIGSGALCSSITFPTNSLTYSKVCGKIRAYQVGAPDSFAHHRGFLRSNSINTNYLDGISLTHGSPRQHIWSFAAALDEAGSIPSLNCPCINRDHASSATRPPAFVGEDYFCDTGSSDRVNTQTFYSDNPLWDGAGCGPLNDCCSFNNPPWFYKQLPQPTTDSIEMRVCRDQIPNDENIAIEIIEIYVQ